MYKIFWLTILLTACTMDGGKLVPGQVWDCTDFRDGETFTIRSENQIEVRDGIGADSYIRIRDDNGKERV